MLDSWRAVEEAFAWIPIVEKEARSTGEKEGRERGVSSVQMFDFGLGQACRVCPAQGISPRQNAGVTGTGICDDSCENDLVPARIGADGNGCFTELGIVGDVLLGEKFVLVQELFCDGTVLGIGCPHGLNVIIVGAGVGSVLGF